MSALKISFRTGFFAGLVLALGIGFYLFLLWDDSNQVRLHAAHLLAALEKNKWSTVAEFLDPSYSDQWGDDRATVLARLRQVLPYARHLRIESRGVMVTAAKREGEWSARIAFDAEPNEVSAFLEERVNTLNEPFVQQWRQVSWKPWDWKLVRVTNPALEISDQLF